MLTLRNRLILASGLLTPHPGGGYWGYMILEGWSFFDSLYMTIISLTTVGYGEIRELGTYGRVFTIFLLLGGMGILAFGIGTFTALLVEGHLSDYLRLRNMEKQIQFLKNHVVLCGYEGEGRYVLEEFIKTNTPFVVIAKDREALTESFPNHSLLSVEGDPTKDHVLRQANLENASGLVSAIPTDSENLLVVLSSREIAPNIRIISCVFDRENEHKFIRVGANAVVMATFIGGLRMASEAIRPTVVSFLDRMLRESDKTLRIEEVQVPENGCELAGKSLREIDFPSKTGLLIVAVRSHRFPKDVYNPKGDFVIESGDILIAIGGIEEIVSLKKLLGYKIVALGEEEVGEKVQTGAQANDQA